MTSQTSQTSQQQPDGAATASTPMVVVAGHVTVDPAQREEYLAACKVIVEGAREAEGCLDVAIGADLVDPARVTVYERWASQAALDAFRRVAPPFSHGDAILTSSVEEYDIARVRPAFGGSD